MKQNIKIISERRGLSSYISEVFQNRGLLYFLFWRHILVRYKQTVLGVLWSILRPLIATIILVLVFNRFIGLESKAVPYPLMVISGLLLWNFFSNSVSAGGMSLVADQILVTRTYIPRLIIPLSAVLGNITEVLITFLLLLLLTFYYDADISWRVIFAPAVIFLIFLLALAISLIFTALHAQYRDFSYIIPFFLQMGFYLSPIAFTASNVPEDLKWLYYINPLAGFIEGFRWLLFADSSSIPAAISVYSVVITFVILYIGLVFFLKTERTIADVI